MNRLPSISKTSISLLLVAVAVVAAPLAMAQLPSGNWQYQWGDDFSGTSLDTTKWNNGTPNWAMSSAAPTAARTDHVKVGDGVLTLEASRVSVGGSEPFAGGVISTYQKHNFNGGYIEARILLPDTPGSWPAFWGLFDGWPPEMDIMEYPIDSDGGTGYAETEYHTAFHYRNSSGGNSAGAGKVNPGSAGDLGGTYHNFGAKWVEDQSVQFYFDGQEVSSFYNADAVAQMQHMYLMLNYAVAGWPGTPSTNQWPVGHVDETKVDFVRVWKDASAKSSDWSPSSSATLVQWDSASNWSNGVPNLGGVTASFDTVGRNAEQRFDWSGRRTLSVMNLDGTTHYRFGYADDRLVLAQGNSGALKPTINIAATTTQNHEIIAQLEIAGGLDINNNSSQPFLLTGQMMGGGGDVRIAGPGAVHFSGNNSYSSHTIIGPGQSPGVAVARGENSLGLGGKVVIGEAGNSTTARLELENNALLHNGIGFRGRHNDSPAIVNNSGDNTLAGTLNVEYGGTTYLIRSDAGLLTLSGSDGQAGGVALDTGENMGSRNIRFEGNGNGSVTGSIRNASGTTVSIAKAGGGTWNFGGSNTYSGPTTVAAGTLILDGTTGYGATTVSGGAMLGGAGTVRSHLTAQTGATLQVGQSSLPLAQAIGVTNGDFEAQAHSAGDPATNIESWYDLNTTGRATDWWLNSSWINSDSPTPDSAALLGDGDNTSGLAKGVGSRWMYQPIGIPGSASDSYTLSLDYGQPLDGTSNRLVAVRIEVFQGEFPNPADDNDLSGLTLITTLDTPRTMLLGEGNFASFSSPLDLVSANTTDPLWLRISNLPGSGRSDSGSWAIVDNVEITAPLKLLGETLTVQGDLTLQTGSTTLFNLGESGNSGRIDIGGNLAVSDSAVFQVLLDDSLTADSLFAGDSWNLLDFATATGSLDQLDLQLPTGLANGLSWDTSLLLQTGELSIVGRDLFFGDADNDFAVSGSDLLAVTNNFGNTGPADGLLLGDADDDGSVSGSDLLAVTNNFGAAATLTSSSAAVPEPPGIAVLLGLCLVAASMRQPARTRLACWS